MFIPTGSQYFATVQGIVWKIVLCEQCATTYGYRIEVSGSGSGSSFLFLNNEGAKTDASLQAQARFYQNAEKKVVPVPCPVCGWYQERMQRVLRRQIHWAHAAGAGVLALALVFFVVPEPAAQIAGAGIAACGLGLVIAGFILRARQDMNSGDPEPRKLLGQSQAVWGEKLTELVKSGQDLPGT